MKRLLIIEDEQSFAGILARRMGKHGFECELAHDATQALLKARQDRKSVV